MLEYNKTDVRLCTKIIKGPVTLVSNTIKGSCKIRLEYHKTSVRLGKVKI